MLGPAHRGAPACAAARRPLARCCERSPKSRLRRAQLRARAAASTSVVVWRSALADRVCRDSQADSTRSVRLRFGHSAGLAFWGGDFTIRTPDWFAEVRGE